MAIQSITHLAEALRRESDLILNQRNTMLTLASEAWYEADAQEQRGHHETAEAYEIEAKSFTAEADALDVVFLSMLVVIEHLAEEPF